MIDLSSTKQQIDHDILVLHGSILNSDCYRLDCGCRSHTDNSYMIFHV